VNDELINMNTPGAAGALSASAGDLVRWQVALVNGRAVSPEGFEEMVEPSVPTTRGTARYGFGLFIDEVDNQRRIFHGGGIPGFNSMLTFLPDFDLHVAVISNSETLSSTAVSDLIIEALTPSPVGAAIGPATGWSRESE
jgi:CubicO group peptidase (beta-lactamase class C family)